MLRILLSALALALALPQLAAACACCDGEVSRNILGWSERGGALVRVTGILHCSVFAYEEILRPGVDLPHRCTDLLSDTPNALNACGDLSTEHDYEDPLRDVAGSHRRRFFPLPARAVSNQHVRAVLVPDAITEAEAEASESHVNELVPRYALAVQVFAGSAWHEVVRAAVWPTRREDNSLDWDDLTNLELALGVEAAHPIRVRVYPSPDGARALVHFSGGDTSGGNGGEWSDTLRWGALPRGVAVEESADAVLATYAHSAAVRPTNSEDRERSVREVNAEGLRLHRARHYERAEQVFIAALDLDHDNDAARYNLACSLARQGHVERAMAELRVLHEAACSGCRRRLRRAQRDPDLATLRDRPEFRALAR